MAKNYIREFNYMSYSLIDFIRTFPEIAHVKDISGHKYILTNKNNLSLFGFEKEDELIGKDVFDLEKIMCQKWPHDYASKVNMYDMKVINTGKPLFAKPDVILNQDGFVVVHSFMKIPLFDASSVMKAILTLVFDSTRQERINNLRTLYIKLYQEKRMGNKKFLQFIGFSKKEAEIITTRELDCVLSLIRRKSLKEVANDLNISCKAVEACLGRVREKLLCYTTAELVHLFTSKLSYKK